MESADQKINDCYFYFYSTCKKGDNCAFRHCKFALGSEDVCPKWRLGQCTRMDCPLRHMETQKKRMSIPCYWENQPGGCRKPHCVFKHFKNIEQNENTNKDKLILPVITNKENHDEIDDSSKEVTSSSLEFQEDDSNVESVTLPTVEPLVVNFDEESDSESCASTPIKKIIDGNENIGENNLNSLKKNAKLDLGIKSLAEIRKEKLGENNSPESNLEEDLRTRLTQRLKKNNSRDLDFKIKTLEEIREERKEIKKNEINTNSTELQPVDQNKKNLTKLSPKRLTREIYRPPSVQLAKTRTKVSNESQNDFGIKSLSEIREERRLREQEELKLNQRKREAELPDSEVTTLKRRKAFDNSDKNLIQKPEITSIEIQVETKKRPHDTDNTNVTGRKKIRINPVKIIIENEVDKDVQLTDKPNSTENVKTVDDDLDFLLGPDDDCSVTSGVKEEELLLELDDIINS